MSKETQQKTTLPRGIRNNNPGNLDFKEQQGAVLEYPKVRFACFDTEFDGLKALSQQLMRYAQGLTTGKKLQNVRDIIDTFAQDKEHDDRESYIKYVAAQLSVSDNTELDLSNAGTMSELMKAIIYYENSMVPYGMVLINEAAISGIQSVTGGKVNTAIKQKQPSISSVKSNSENGITQQQSVAIPLDNAADKILQLFERLDLNIDSSLRKIETAVQDTANVVEKRLNSLTVTINNAFDSFDSKISPLGQDITQPNNTEDDTTDTILTFLLGYSAGKALDSLFSNITIKNLGKKVSSFVIKRIPYIGAITTIMDFEDKRQQAAENLKKRSAEESLKSKLSTSDDSKNGDSFSWTNLMMPLPILGLSFVLSELITERIKALMNSSDSDKQAGVFNGVNDDISEHLSISLPDVKPANIEANRSYIINSQPQFHINVAAGTSEQQLSEIRMNVAKGTNDAEQILIATINGSLA